MTKQSLQELWTRLRRSPFGLTAERALRGLARALTSTTFAICILGPFASWAVVLLWVQQQFPDQVAHAVAQGPGVLVHAWMIITGCLFPVALGLGRHRQLTSIYLALVTLVALQLSLPAPASPHAQRVDVVDTAAIPRTDLSVTPAH